ncbi:MAG TPA: terminase, partial [Mycobacterium sp.]|nr:terminase [Mycobacterium sp.]
ALDEAGRFAYRHLVRRLAKGSGKSPWAAYLALCELCGPVRFSHWDPSVPGGAVGKPESMPLVQLAATAESQVSNTQRYVREFAAKGSRLAKEYSLDPGKTVIYKPGGGELRVITSSSTGAEGAQPSFVVLDETEHHLPSNGGGALFETLDRNAAKRSGRLLETANAWEPGSDSVAERTWAAFQAQQEGRVRTRTKILYDCVEAPADTDLGDDASLRAALDLVYSDCPWIDTDGIAERVWSPTTRPAVSRRFYLNQRVADEDAWTTPQAWAACTDATRVVEDQEDVVLFFDGSKSRDATALLGCCISDGHVFTVGVWEPDPAHDADDVVPVAAVDAAVEQAFDRYRVVAFFADVKEWEGFVKVTWPERYAADLLVWSARNAKDAQSIAWDMRTRVYDFTQAVELTEAEINDQKFTHDGDSRVARHVANARRRPNRWGLSIGKESPDSPKKVDAAVCVVGARMVRRLVLASPEWIKRTARRRTGRVVGFRG